ncbi:hypothetical protein [Micromonospora haikouensis]
MSFPPAARMPAIERFDRLGDVEAGELRRRQRLPYRSPVHPPAGAEPVG